MYDDKDKVEYRQCNYVCMTQRHTKSNRNLWRKHEFNEHIRYNVYHFGMESIVKFPRDPKHYTFVLSSSMRCVTCCKCMQTIISIYSSFCPRICESCAFAIFFSHFFHDKLNFGFRSHKYSYAYTYTDIRIRFGLWIFIWTLYVVSCRNSFLPFKANTVCIPTTIFYIILFSKRVT